MTSGSGRDSRRAGSLSCKPWLMAGRWSHWTNIGCLSPSLLAHERLQWAQCRQGQPGGRAGAESVFVGHTDEMGGDFSTQVGSRSHISPGSQAAGLLMCVHLCTWHVCAVCVHDTPEGMHMLLNTFCKHGGPGSGPAPPTPTTGISALQPVWASACVPGLNAGAHSG